MGLKSRLGKYLSNFLVKDTAPSSNLLCDFERISYEVRPGDVLLVEGRSRVSEVIKMITQSPWSHSALYIGRIHDIDDPEKQQIVRQYSAYDDNEQLLIEAILGKGTIITPLNEYSMDHLRICRPTGLSPRDAQDVIGFAISNLGLEYDVRNLLDLARFLFPYGILPRRWRSSLFDHNSKEPTHTVCSTMIAKAFMAVKFPILPVVHRHKDGKVSFYQRNPKRFTPRDFDYSPYFEIIKYPYIEIDNHALYAQLPWNMDGVLCNDVDDCFIPNEHQGPGDEAGSEAETEKTEVK
ncbi:MAG: hypothetical protein BMS9Abin26_1770 [Gammaproteobacteria bacterium]|nr:MAG: hypothetical protein BMS9Abin26_1770 [Gammaproteobacteria bacterium]